MKVATLTAIALLAPAVLLAQSPFDGTWVLNTQRSDFTGVTMTIEDAGGGAIRIVTADFSPTVKTDGTRVETPDGGAIAIRKTNDRSYHRTDWMNGQELSQSDWDLSGDANTLTVREYGTNPAGDAFNNTVTYSRVSGTGGLAGEWKIDSANIDEPVRWTLELSGDTLRWDVPGIDAQMILPLDGTPTHPEGPTVPASFMASATMQGPRTLQVVQTIEGRITGTATMTVAPDGKTLSSEETNARGEVATAIWEKQN